jgi:hypothetical protein
MRDICRRSRHGRALVALHFGITALALFCCLACSTMPRLACATPFVLEVSPVDGAQNYSPEGNFRAVIVDAVTQLNPPSVKVYLDGSLVAHTRQGAGGTNVITFSPASLPGPQSAHEYRLEFSDNGSPAVSETNRYTFTVSNYLNLLLPTPIVLETFDQVPEGGLPTGWSVTNATTIQTPGLDLNAPNSDSYLNWVVISSNRFANLFDQRRLNVALAVTNGHLVKSLITGNFAYAESDNRGGNQVQVLFSPDFDLTGKTNVYLSFHNIYEQNQDSAASVEYSIDEGATWLPALYMLDGPDVIRDGSGVIDAVATLTTARGDQAYAQSYGSFIGAVVSQNLAPFISARVNDDARESKRVEFLRLAQADNQPKVRLRFAQYGTGSWYFGIDEVGLYSVAPPIITGFAPVSAIIGASITITGSNFDPIASNNIVCFGTVRGNVTSATATQLLVSVPAGAAYAPVSVTVGGLTGVSRLPFGVAFVSDGPMGTNLFAPPVTFLPLPHYSDRLAVGDIDGDGRNDLVVSYHADAVTISVRVFTNRASPGSFTTDSLDNGFIVDSGQGLTSIADFDGDGKLDLVAYRYIAGDPLHAEWDVYRNSSSPGALAFTKSAVLAPNGIFLALIGIGDLDGDGRPDLLGKSTNNTFFAMRNASSPGSIIFEPPVPLMASCGILGDNAQFADLDGDGKLDLLLGGGSGCPVEIFRSLATPGSLDTNSFAPPFSLPFAPGNHPLAIADYDGDGKLDVAMLDCGNIVRVFRNISTPGILNTNSFAQPVSFAAGGWPFYSLLATDLDGDGRPDLVTAGCATNDLHCGGICGTNFVSVLQNVSVTGAISSNSFAAPVTFSAGSIGTFPVVGDMDGDGRPDLIVRTYVGYFSVWRNTMPPACAPRPPGLVAWWKGDGSAADIIDTNHGTLRNGANFSAGIVGQAFNFDGVDDYIDLGSPAILRFGGHIPFSIEGWIWPLAGGTVIGKFDRFVAGEWIVSVSEDGHIGFHREVSPFFITSAHAVSFDTFSHIAVTYDGQFMRIFINGLLDAETDQLGAGQSADNTKVLIGAHFEMGQPAHFFRGRIDELAVFNRALTASEIAAIFTAGSNGMCPQPPQILTQPIASSFVIENQASTLSVTAEGGPPLYYQWFLNGTAIPGATNNSINFSNTLFANRGSYSVVVSNPSGSVTSSVATVLVRAQPWIYWSTAGELPSGPPDSKIKRAWLDGTHQQIIVTNAPSGTFRFGGIVCDPVRRRIYSGDGVFLFHVNLDGSARTDLVGYFFSENWITDLGIDLARGKLFWMKLGGLLYRANLNGPFNEIVANGPAGDVAWEGLAIDESSGKVYWANNVPSGNTIEVANEDGSERSTFQSIPGTLPFDVAIDPVERRLYWNEYGHTRYMRANLDGTGPVETVFTSGNGGGNGIHFDEIGRKLYFSSGTSGASAPIYLNRVNPDGSGFETVFTDLGRMNYITVVYPSQTNRLDVAVQGSGTVALTPSKTFYDFGELVTMSASPGPNYTFNGWGDGDTNNPRTITVGFSNSYTAILVPAPEVPRVFVNSALATVSATVTNIATITLQSSFPGAMIFFSLDGSDPAAAVNASLYTAPFSLTDSATIRAIAYSSDFLSSAEADPIALAVVHSPLIFTQPQSQVLAAGDTLVLDVSAIGDGPLSYQWRKNGVSVGGVTSSPVLMIVAAQGSDAGNYSVVVSNTHGSTTSADAAVTVIQPPVVQAQPSTLNVALNDPAAFCVTVSGDPLLRYQWRKNGVNLPGETNQCLVFDHAQVSDGGSYSVVVENDIAAVVSAAAQLRINLITVPGGDAFADRIEILERCFSGSNVGATSQLGEPRHAGKVGGKSIWYSWVAPATGIATFETAGSSFDTLLAVYIGTDIATLTPIAADEDDGGFLSSRVRFNAVAGAEYQIVVDGYAGGQGTYTICWTLDAAPLPLPVIVTQPGSQTVRETQPATFSVLATSVVAKITFQWFFNGASLEGETNSTLSIASVLPQHVGYYRVGVSNASVGLLSDTAILEIGPVPGAQSVDKLPDLFAPPPGPVAPVAGRSGLAAAAAATGVQISVSAGSIDSQVINNTGSATSPTEPLPCRVLGGASRWLWLVPSETATLRIDTIGSTIDTVLGVFVGTDPASIVPLANGCNDNGAPDGIRSLVQFTAQAGVGYYVQADGKSGTNGIIRINWGLGTAPGSTQNPTRYTVRQGDSLTLTNLSTGIPAPTFRWRHDDITLANATNRVLALSSVQPGDAGAYSVIVSNYLGVITNLIATITVQSNVFTAAQDTFDSTHLAWAASANATATYPTSGGNPAGYLAFRGSGLNQLAAPPEYLGDKFFCYNGLMSFDLRRPVAGQADIVLVGADLTLVFDLPNATGTGWTSHKLLLHEAAGWRKNGIQPATHAEFLAVLGNLSGVFVHATDAIIDVDNLEFLAPTLPVLSLHPDGSEWLIQWPAAIGPYTVESASSLGGNAWASVSAPVTTVNNLNSMRIQSTPGQRFFRLRRN